jgi:hypothetical protein
LPWAHRLLALNEAQGMANAPTAQFLVNLGTSCRALNAADRVYQVHWSRYLFASLRWKTGCELFVGASAVTCNPHFLYFFSLHLVDECLGAVREWPSVLLPALLVIDSFARITPHLRGPMLEQAVAHRPGVWVLKQHDGNPDQPVLAKLRRVACLQAELPKKSRVLHQVGCWETAAWDVETSRFIMYNFRITAASTSPRSKAAALRLRGIPSLCLPLVREFSPPPAPHPPSALTQHQQVALRHSWDGLVAGTDGSIDKRTEVMGSDYVLGVDPQPIISFFARVGATWWPSSLGSCGGC